MWHIFTLILAVAAGLYVLFWLRHVIRQWRYQTWLSLLWDLLKIFFVPALLVQFVWRTIDDKVEELDKSYRANRKGLKTDEKKLTEDENKTSLSAYRLKELQARGLKWK